MSKTFAIALPADRFAAVFGTPTEDRTPGRSRRCRVCGDWHRSDEITPLPRSAKRGEASAFLDAAKGYDNNECLFWPFSLKDNGYVSVGSRSTKKYAHRIVCEARNGPPPTSRHEAAHCCGNRSCVNPRHQRWASHVENHADRIEHGTSNRGEHNGNARLTIEIVRLARAAFEGGVSLKILAEVNNVAIATMSNVVRRRTWAWVI